MNKIKSFTLASGGLEGSVWRILALIYPNGTFENKGRLALQKAEPTKAFVLLSGYVEGWTWEITTEIKPNGTIKTRGHLNFREGKGNYKTQTRAKDRTWVKLHLPLSFRQKYTENHHDWSNDATLYRLTHNEHIEKHRAAKRQLEQLDGSLGGMVG